MQLIRNLVFLGLLSGWVFCCGDSANGATTAKVFLAGLLHNEEDTISLSRGETRSFENITVFSLFLGTTSATVGISEDGWHLRVATATDLLTPFVLLMNSTATVGTTRTGTMSGLGTRPDFLVLNGKLSGNIEITDLSDTLHDGSMKVGSFQINVLDELFFTDAGTYVIDRPFQAVVPVATDGSFHVDMSLYSESWTRWGRTAGDFLHTLSLTSITLPSGELPEDAGWTLEFDDGVRSPNIPVPEPATAAMAALGLVSMLLPSHCRRRA